MKALPPVDVRAMTCRTLMSTSDDDKAYASTFLLGYRAALTRVHTIDVKKIEAVEEAALAQCAASPDAIANKVFAAALVKVERAERSSTPPIRFRRRLNPPPPASSDQGSPAPSAPQPAPDRPTKE